MVQAIKKTPSVITGKDLRRLRIHANLTTQELAKLLGVKSRKTVENWESEFCEPTINGFMLYCVYTGFNPGKVVSEIEKRNQIDPTQKATIDLEKCLT